MGHDRELMATTPVNSAEDREGGLERGGLSPMDLRFLVLGPALSEAFIVLYDSSAVYIHLAIVPRERGMVCVCQLEGPAYLGTG